MKIETKEQSEKLDSPIIGVYDIKLKVGDGMRFGFGFGLGIFLWGLLLSAIIVFGLWLLLFPFVDSTLKKTNPFFLLNPTSQSTSATNNSIIPQKSNEDYLRAIKELSK
jgi:hypothetical protein